MPNIAATKQTNLQSLNRQVASLLLTLKAFIVDTCSQTN